MIYGNEYLKTLPELFLPDNKTTSFLPVLPEKSEIHVLCKPQMAFFY